MSLVIFLAFVLIYLRMQNEKFGIGQCVLLILLFWTATGAKGPAGPILLGSFCLVVMVNMFRKNGVAAGHLILCGLLMLAFLLNMTFIFGGFGHSSEDIQIYPFDTFFRSALYTDAIVRYLRDYPALQIFMFPFMFLSYMIGSFAYRLSGLSSLKDLVLNWRNAASSKLFIAFIILLSLISGFSLRVRGMSELYFTFYGYFLLSLFSAAMCYEYLKRSTFLIRLILAGTIFLTFFPIMWGFYDGIICRTTGSYLKYNQFFNGLSGRETELIYKLKSISQPDDIVLGNAFFIDEKKTDPRFFCGSGISGRRFFLEGWRYGPIQYPGFEERKSIVFSFLEGRENIREFVKYSGIRYFIWFYSRASGVSPFANYTDADIIFENKAGKIYRIKQFSGTSVGK